MPLELRSNIVYFIFLDVTLDVMDQLHAGSQPKYSNIWENQNYLPQTRAPFLPSTSMDTQLTVPSLTV